MNQDQMHDLAVAALALCHAPSVYVLMLRHATLASATKNGVGLNHIGTLQQTDL